MSKIIIECNNLCKEYKNGVQAVKNASLSFEEGKFYAIMGHSGSGKTTLLQMLGLLDDFTSGEICVIGESSKKLSTNQKSDIRRDVMGFVFQSYYLNSRLKAYENVMIPMLINDNIKDKKSKAISILESFGLSDRINHFPRELSGGEQQRVAIARALANNPACILGDEPTGNLDGANERIVLEYLKKCSSEYGKCVIVVSHNSIVKEYADTVFQMENGEII